MVTAPTLILALLYADGYIAQWLGNYALWQQAGGVPGHGAPEPASADFFACLASAFRMPYGLYGLLLCVGLLGLLLVMVMRMGYSEDGTYDKDRNFT